MVDENEFSKIKIDDEKPNSDLYDLCFTSVDQLEPDECASTSFFDQGENRPAEYNYEHVGATSVVGFLEEAAYKRYFVQPHYFERCSGPSHAPTFEVVCKTLGYECSGHGNSKAVAKNMAVRNVLKAIIEAPDEDYKHFYIPGDTKEQRLAFVENLYIRSNTATPKSQEFLKDNFVGKLQELCMKNKLGAPQYDFEQKGPSHAPTFVATCQVDNHTSESDEFKTKKDAKAQAAFKIYQMLSKSIADMEREFDICSDDEGDGEELCQVFEVDDDMGGFAESKVDTRLWDELN